MAETFEVKHAAERQLDHSFDGHRWISGSQQDAIIAKVVPMGNNVWSLTHSDGRVEYFMITCVVTKIDRIEGVRRIDG